MAAGSVFLATQHLCSLPFAQSSWISFCLSFFLPARSSLDGPCKQDIHLLLHQAHHVTNIFQTQTLQVSLEQIHPRNYYFLRDFFHLCQNFHQVPYLSAIKPIFKFSQSRLLLLAILTDAARGNFLLFVDTVEAAWSRRAAARALCSGSSRTSDRNRLCCEKPTLHGPELTDAVRS